MFICERISNFANNILKQNLRRTSRDATLWRLYLVAINIQ